MSNGNNHNRRHVLRCIGATGIALSAASTTATADDGWRGTGVVTFERPFDDPVTAAELHDAAADLHDQYVAASGVEGPDPYHVSTPKTIDGSLVAAALRVAPDGRVQQYTGVAGSPGDVGRVHRALAAERRALRSGGDDRYATTSSDSWSVKNDGKYDNYSDPYGELVDNYTLRYHDDQPAYEYDQTLQMSAGSLAYGSDWRNDYANHRQDWSDNGATMEIEDHAPSQVYDGSTSYSVTMEGTISTTGGSATVGYGYTYSQSEVDMTDKSLDSENLGEWKMDVAQTGDPDGPDYNTVSFDPGTMAEFESALNGDILLEMESNGVFTDGVDSHTLTNWNQFSQGSDGCRNC